MLVARVKDEPIKAANESVNMSERMTLFGGSPISFIGSLGEDTTTIFIMDGIHDCDELRGS